MRTSFLSSRGIRRLSLVFLAVAVPAACGDEPVGTDAASSGSGAGPSAAIEARFELPESGAPAFMDVPFPSDLYLDENQRVGDIPGIEAVFRESSSYLVAGLRGNAGWSSSGGAMFRIDDTRVVDPDSGLPTPAKLDRATFPQTEAASTSQDATVMLVDLGAADAASALVPARVAYQDDSELGARFRPSLVVYPARGTILIPGRRYAAVLTSGVKTDAGEPVAASPTMAAILDGSRRTTDAERVYGEAVDQVRALFPALTGERGIAAVAVYTTHDGQQELFDLRSDALAGPVATVSWDPAMIAPMGTGLFSAQAPVPVGYSATLDEWLGTPDQLGDGTDDPADDQPAGRAHDAIAAIGTAVIEVPNYLRERDGAYEDAEHRTFERDADGRPIVNPTRPTSKIWITISLPEGPAPAGGFPAVILQHGLGGDRSFALGIANTFAKRGWATVATESVTFGARAATDELTTDAAAGFAWSAEPLAYDGPDGFVDKRNGPSDFFGTLKSLGALRDQMRQSVLDLGALADTLRDPALDLGPLLLAVPDARIDGSKLAYLGDSLGAIMGAMFAAVDPNVGTFVLNVAGGGLYELANGPYIGNFLNLAALNNFGITSSRIAPGHPLMQMIQHVADLGDPLTYAHRIVREPATVGATANPRKNVLQLEVLFDELVPNEANEALAHAAGFPLGEPSVGSRAGLPLESARPNAGAISGVPFPEITAVLIQAGPATHSSNLFSRGGTHGYEHPWGLFDEAKPFTTLDDKFTVEQPYLALQDTMVGFIASAFEGSGPPVVSGFPAPTLDYDGDGALDAVDASPNDPAAQ